MDCIVIWKGRFRSFSAGKPSLKKRGREFGQVPPPHHPGVFARGLDIRVANAFGSKPRPESSVDLNQMVIGSTSNPKQVKFRVGTCIQRGKILVELFCNPPELNAPIHANLSKVFKPVSNDSAPPIERPAMARASFVFSALGIMF
jgi:hypothetical protein